MLLPLSLFPQGLWEHSPSWLQRHVLAFQRFLGRPPHMFHPLHRLPYRLEIHFFSPFYLFHSPISVNRGWIIDDKFSCIEAIRDNQNICWNLAASRMLLFQPNRPSPKSQMKPLTSMVIFISSRFSLTIADTPLS